MPAYIAWGARGHELKTKKLGKNELEHDAVGLALPTGYFIHVPDQSMWSTLLTGKSELHFNNMLELSILIARQRE